MAVPTTIKDVSTTAASNSPAGSDSIGNPGSIDDYFRGYGAVMRSESLNKDWERWNDTPTYVSGTQFTVATDLTSRYVVNRRFKATVTAGTVYGKITVSAFTSVTTVTVVCDSGALDSGLSEVWLGPEVKSFATIDGATIGATNAAAGTFTTLTSTGNTTLGNAQGDTLNVGNGDIIKDASGNVGIGVTPTEKLQVNSGADANVNYAALFKNTYNSSNAGASAIGFSVNDVACPKGAIIYERTSNWGLGSIHFSTNQTADNTTKASIANAKLTITSAGNVGIGVTPTQKFHVAGATSGNVYINDTGQLYGSALHNNAGAVTGTTNQYIASGTDEPTITAHASTCTVTSPGNSQWMRVGNVVTVSGRCNVDPDATSAPGWVQFTIELPVASNFTQAYQLGGTLWHGNNNYDPGQIYADTGTDTAFCQFYNSATSHIAGDVAFHFTYVVV